MLNFFKRFVNYDEPQKTIPTLVLGKDASSYHKVVLPTSRYTRENQIIITSNLQTVRERLLRKYINQDLRFEQSYHSNREFIETKSNNQIDYVSGLIVISPNVKFNNTIKLDALQMGIPKRDIYVFNPLSPDSARFNLMSLPLEAITSFIFNLVKNDADDTDIAKLKESWIKRIVFLEKIYAKLNQKQPSPNDLLEFFRNPTAIMDVLHFVEDKYDGQDNEILQSIKDLKDNFRLGDSLQNKVNFAIYDIIFHFTKDNTLGEYLFAEVVTPLSFNELVAKGGLILFDIDEAKLSSTDKELWLNLIKLSLSNGFNNRKQETAAQLPIYLIEFDDYLDKEWLNIIKRILSNNVSTTLQVDSIQNISIPNKDKDIIFSAFGVRSCLNNRNYSHLKEINPFFLTKKDREFGTNSNLFKYLNPGMMVTRLNNHHRANIIMF